MAPKYRSKISEGYFSIDDIVTTNQRVPCRFNNTFPKLGFLDASSEGADIEANTKLELPIWLAKGLKSRRIVTMEFPLAYQESYQDILSADSSVVDLNKIGPYYYMFGQYIQTCMQDDTIWEMLTQAFRGRFRLIMDCAQNTNNEHTTGIVSRLDAQEKDIYELGRQAFKDYLEWQKHKMEKIVASSLVAKHKKRKLVALNPNYKE